MATDQNFSLSRIPSLPRSIEVENQLMRAIQAGKYPPGSRLPPERELAETFDVSRVSVRAALRSLAALRIIETAQGRGSFVRSSPTAAFEQSFRDWLSIHTDEVVELLEVRGALEALAVAHAARAHTRAARNLLHRAHRNFTNAAESGVAADVAQADLEFHAAIARASGSELLGDLLDHLQRTLHEARSAVFALRGRPWSDSVEQHGSILEAIEATDAAGAAEAMNHHVAVTIAFVRQLIGDRNNP